MPATTSALKTSEFHYDLPVALIAQAPLPQRSASRLLEVRPAPAPLQDRHMRDLPGILRAGDLLVFNDTLVIPARLFGAKRSGGRVEVLIERLLGPSEALAQIRASKAPKPGGVIDIDCMQGEGMQVEVSAREGDFHRLHFATDDLAGWLQQHGRMPLPPYVQRDADANDAQRYQTVFARVAGAVAAPTAGLHFDAELLQALQARGIETAQLTLHVGAGTFQPVRVDDIAEHHMHREWFDVDASLIRQIGATRERRGRVIAVGTTVLRALESAMRDGELQAGSGETELFITPGYSISSVDALLTNFHLPRSTLLMLVSAFAGQARVFEAYAHAIAARYRFFSYGDAMLLWPPATVDQRAA